MSWDQVWALVTWERAGDVVKLIGGIAALWIAKEGLSTWRAQLKGETEYNIARRLLLLLYRLRNAINSVRDPGMPSSEWLGRPGRVDGSPDADAEDVAYAYQQRWNKLVDASTPYETDLLEAEAIWGREIVRIPKNELRQLISELLAALHMWVEMRRDAQGVDPSEKRSVRQTVFRLGPGNDPFDERLVVIVGKFEDVLRPHLRR